MSAEYGLLFAWGPTPANPDDARALSPLVLAELHAALAHYRSGGGAVGLACEVEKVIARADAQDDAGERHAWEAFASAAIVGMSRGGIPPTADAVATVADSVQTEWRARFAPGVPR